MDQSTFARETGTITTQFANADDFLDRMEDKLGSEDEDNAWIDCLPPAQTPSAFLPLGEVHVPYPSSLAHHARLYSCPGQMSVEDQIYLVPGFDLTTQMQVLRCVWRPQLGTFKYVLDTIPQTVPDCPKLPQWMHYCSQEIVDVDGRLLYFTSKEDLMCHINHHRTSHWSSHSFIQSNNHSSGTLVSLLGGWFFLVWGSFRVGSF